MEERTGYDRLQFKGDSNKKERQDCLNRSAYFGIVFFGYSKKIKGRIMCMSVAGLYETNLSENEVGWMRCGCSVLGTALHSNHLGYQAAPGGYYLQ